MLARAPSRFEKLNWEPIGFFKTLMSLAELDGGGGGLDSGSRSLTGALSSGRQSSLVSPRALGTEGPRLGLGDVGGVGVLQHHPGLVLRRGELGCWQVRVGQRMTG